MLVLPPPLVDSCPADKSSRSSTWTSYGAGSALGSAIGSSKTFSSELERGERIKPERANRRNAVQKMQWRSSRWVTGFAAGEYLGGGPHQDAELDHRISSMTIADVSPRFAVKRILLLYENQQHREAANFINRLSHGTFKVDGTGGPDPRLAPPGGPGGPNRYREEEGPLQDTHTKPLEFFKRHIKKIRARGVIVNDLPIDLFVESMPASLSILEALYAKVFLSDGLDFSLKLLRPEAVVMQMVRLFAGSDANNSWQLCGPFVTSCKKLLKVIVLSEPKIRKMLQARRRALDKAIEGLGQHGLVGTSDETLMNLHDALKVEFSRVVETYKGAMQKLEDLSLAGQNAATGINRGPAPVQASHQRQLSLRQPEIQERLIKNKTLLNVVEPTMGNHSLDILLGILQRRIECDKDALFQFTTLKREARSGVTANDIVAPVLMRFSHGCDQVSAARRMAHPEGSCNVQLQYQAVLGRPTSPSKRTAEEVRVRLSGAHCQLWRRTDGGHHHFGAAASLRIAVQRANGRAAGAENKTATAIPASVRRRRRDPLAALLLLSPAARRRSPARLLPGVSGARPASLDHRRPARPAPRSCTAGARPVDRNASSPPPAASSTRNILRNPRPPPCPACPGART
ncbi:hypothetical protein FOCC_FOCC011461 [Frankliniella occidentalis]|nr:hypothetical protein FOCC_FOCC011461 [Frankliniella occidentalis]